MGMELGRGVTVYRSAAVMFKLCRYPLAGRFCRMIAANSRLDILFQFIEGHIYGFPVRLPDSFISSNQSREADAFRGGKSCIPPGAVFHGFEFFAVGVGVLVWETKPD